MNRKVNWMKCTGEAHKNPYIDNCIVCLPFWEEYPVCPKCGRKAKKSKRGKYSYYCTECKLFLLENEESKISAMNKITKVVV